MGSGVPQHFLCPKRFGALPTRDVHQDSEIAELILESFCFFRREPESDQRSGIPAESRSFPRHIISTSGCFFRFARTWTPLC